MTTRKPYPSDVSDDEGAFVVPYLTLMIEEAPQRDYPLREVFNGLRYLVRTGSPWRYVPNDLPPWHTVYDRSRQPFGIGKDCDGPSTLNSAVGFVPRNRYPAVLATRCRLPV